MIVNLYNVLENLINISITLTLCAIVVLPVKRLFRHRMNSTAHIFVWVVVIIDVILFGLISGDYSANHPFHIRQFFPQANPVEYALTLEEIVKQESLADAELSGTETENNAEVQGNEAGNVQVSEAGNALGNTGTESQAGGAEAGITGAAGNATQPPNGEWQDTDNAYTQGSNNAVTSVINVPGIGSFNITQKDEKIILGVWIAGMIAMAGIQVGRYIKLRRDLAGLPDCTDEETLAIFDECKQIIGTRWQIPLKVGAESTMLVGMLSRPTIYIRDDIPKNELKYVFAHELCHLRHADVRFNIAAAIFIAVFWFNPVMYIVFREFLCDVEARCDERTTEALGSRREYAEVLVRASAGQKGFVLASTSFLGGEKEVEARIKRIVFSDRRKKGTEVVALMLIMLLVTACVSAPSDRPGINGTVPVRITENMQIEVPHLWLDDMKPMSIEGGEGTYLEETDDAVFVTREYDGSLGTVELTSVPPTSIAFNMPLERAFPYMAMTDGKVFFDMNGDEFAAIFRTGILSEQEWYALNVVPPTTSPDAAGDDLTVDDALIAKKMDALISDVFTEEKGFGEIKKRNVPDTKDANTEEYRDFFIYGTDFSDEEDSRSIYSIGAMFDGTNAVVLAVKSNEMGDSDIIKTLKTFKLCERAEIGNTAYSDIEEFEGAQGRRELTEDEYMKLAKKALDDSLKLHTQRDLPVDMAVDGYSIGFADDYEYNAGDDAKPETQPGYKYYYDNAIWDVIYPNARVYKVEYDLKPLDERYYKGETHFEKHAVFAVNHYINPTDITDEMIEENGEMIYEDIADFYFLGFVEDRDARIYTDTDSIILSMLDDWYIRVNPYSGSFSTDYVGDHNTVDKIVNSLPFREYINTSNGTFAEGAIELQTAEEPYGLAITYTIPRKLPEVSDDMWFTPITPQMQAVLDAPYNAYIADQINWNIGRLYQTIGNLGEVTITVNFVDERSQNEDTITATHTEYTTREGFYEY